MAADTRFGAADDPDAPDPLLRPAWEDSSDETDADRPGARPRWGNAGGRPDWDHQTVDAVADGDRAIADALALGRLAGARGKTPFGSAGDAEAMLGGFGAGPLMRCGLSNGGTNLRRRFGSRDGEGGPKRPPGWSPAWPMIRRRCTARAVGPHQGWGPSRAPLAPSSWDWAAGPKLGQRLSPQRNRQMLNNASPAFSRYSRIPRRYGSVSPECNASRINEHRPPHRRIAREPRRRR
jgi:hypothetical protein